MEEIDSLTIQVMKALGSGKRIRLLFLLRKGKKTLHELNRALGTKGGHLFASLNALTAAQLVCRVKVDTPTWEITDLGMLGIEIYQYARQQIGNADT